MTVRQELELVWIFFFLWLLPICIPIIRTLLIIMFTTEKIYPACYCIFNMLQINTPIYLFYTSLPILYHLQVCCEYSLSPYQDINKDAIQSQALWHTSSSLSPARLETYHNLTTIWVQLHFLVYLILHLVNVLLVCLWGCYGRQKALLASIKAVPPVLLTSTKILIIL